MLIQYFFNFICGYIRIFLDIERFLDADDWAGPARTADNVVSMILDVERRLVLEIGLLQGQVEDFKAELFEYTGGDRDGGGCIGGWD